MNEINIYKILSWIFLVGFAILLIWYILGDSPAESLVFIIFITGLFTNLYTKLSSIEKNVLENKINLKNHINNYKNHIETYHTRGKRK